MRKLHGMWRELSVGGFVVVATIYHYIMNPDQIWFQHLLLVIVILPFTPFLAFMVIQTRKRNQLAFRIENRLCLNCGYDLKGLKRKTCTCPECGVKFNRNATLEVA